MSPLPNPPLEQGLTWRPWTVDDAAAMGRHFLRIHEAEGLSHVPGPDSLAWLAGQEGFDPATNSLIAIDERGEVCAEAGAWEHVSEAGARVFIWADADPGYDHLRAFLLDWAEARAREMLDKIPDTSQRTIRFGVEEHRHGARAAIEAAGFENARSFAVMRRRLSDLPELPAIPEGIRVEPWSRAIDEADGIRQVSNEAFADHWGSLPMSREMWAALHIDSEIFRPDLSFVALAGDRVVAFCSVEFDPEDAATRGSVEYYINRVGTSRDFRRQRLASHLIIRSLQRAAEVGGDTAALEVDESSHTNATVVYSRLGFEVVERIIHYVKNL